MEKVCSFCGKTLGEAQRLIEGPGVYICNECVEYASELLFEEDVKGDVDMGKLSAEGVTAQSFVNYPKDWYNAHVKGATVQYTKATGATMIVIDWKPDEGPQADNPGSIREWVMVKGKSAGGDDLRTDKYYDRLDALGIKRDYTCCNTMGSNRRFVVKKEDGKYYCPHCGNIANVDIDTNEDGTLPWNGLCARIQVNIEKVDGSDDERNRIGRVIPLGAQVRS